MLKNVNSKQQSMQKDESQSIKAIKTQELDNLISLVYCTKQGSEVKFAQQSIKVICQQVRAHFLSQPCLLRVQSPIKVVGDIHGQFQSLLKIFKQNGQPQQKTRYLFLGDYVDRGKQSIQTIMLLFIYVLKYPNQVYLLRGNHQTAELNKLYGFYDECKRRYNLKVWKYFVDTFNCMPISALIQNKILCMHGGISPELVKVKKIESINRPTQIPPSGLLCDILWSDPVQDKKGWNDNIQRGISKLFGSDVLQKFLNMNDLDLVCRAHQIVEEGYQFFAKKQLVTVFSAPNYCGQFQNNGAVMCVGKDLVCSFNIIKAQTKVQTGKKKKMPKYIN